VRLGKAPLANALERERRIELQCTGNADVLGQPAVGLAPLHPSELGNTNTGQVSKRFPGEIPTRSLGFDVPPDLPQHHVGLARFHFPRSLLHGADWLQINADCESIRSDRQATTLRGMRISLVGASAALLMLLAGCGSSDDPSPQADESAAVEGDAGITDAPSPTEPVASPDTKVVTCEIQDGLPVAEVKVANTTDQVTAFSVEVQFLDGDTVLGTGLEFTQELQPGQDQTIRMGNMQGDAAAVDTCEVLEAVPMDE
jgi:hypothetical protein